MVRVTATGSRSFSPSADEAFCVIITWRSSWTLEKRRKTRVRWDELRSVCLREKRREEVLQSAIFRATRLRTSAEPLEPSSSPTFISRRCWNSIRRWLSPRRGSVCGSRNRTSAFACHQDDRPFCPGRQESDGQHRMTHTLMMKMIALRRGHRDPAATMNDGVLCHVHSIIRWKLQRFSLVGRHLGHVIHYLNESAA